MDNNTEYLDLLDDNGIPTGKTVGREEAHTKGSWHRVVRIWIVNSQGEVLLQKRSPNKKSHPNLWAMSCEGHLSAGQTSLEGAVREINEELGLEVDKNDLELLLTHKASATFSPGRISNHFIDVYLLRLDLDITRLKLQKEEVTEVHWMKIDEYIEKLKSNDPAYKPYDNELDILKSMIGK